uniref:VOC family protein n=1 Tax=Bacteroides thetaiotaomicron TaxID=818 RepID=UPI0034A187F3
MKKFIAFFEIPTVDFHRAVDFYETVFGVQLPVFECEEEKMACFTEEGETVGAIFHAPDYGSPDKSGGKFFNSIENLHLCTMNNQ